MQGFNIFVFEIFCPSKFISSDKTKQKRMLPEIIVNSSPQGYTTFKPYSDQDPAPENLTPILVQIKLLKMPCNFIILCIAILHVS